MPGAICSRILPVALNNGKTSMKTATETIPRHRTSAFSILRVLAQRELVNSHMISGKRRETLENIFTPMKETKKLVSSQHCKRMNRCQLKSMNADWQGTKV